MLNARMPTLSEYYQLLLEHEGVPATDLIAPWNTEIVAIVTASIRDAFTAAGMAGVRIPISAGSSNQSIGNQVANFFASTISPHLRNHRITSCTGQGYPDMILLPGVGGQGFPFEIKATSDWNPSDSNRRVLTCSSDKLRRHFRAPIHHLLGTVIYRPDGAIYILQSVRLDFLNPNTPVSIRLEGSVSHKLLAQSGHPTAHIV